MIIQFDKKITNSNPQLFEYIGTKNLFYPIYYVIDSNLRKSVAVSSWSKSFIEVPCKELIEACKDISDNKDYDYVITDILRWVQKNITYTGDIKSWKMSEYWQTPQETLQKGTGDCEDGAILIYAMAIYKGVPASRMLLFAGSVDGGGHCWLGYKSNEYPLNWCFMDWCYWYNRNTPNNRTKYYIKDTTIYNDDKNQYYNIWFGFNHLTSHRGIMNKQR